MRKPFVKHDQTTAEISCLVESHLHLTQRAARLVYRRIHRYVELEELVALGNVGLVQAASRYDAQRGASFSTYAWYRVMGAILDGVRSSTPLPRGVWRQLLALRSARENLEQRTESANADALDAIRTALHQVQTMYIRSSSCIARASIRHRSRS